MSPTDIDIVMLDWTLSLDLPIHILLTKSDKLKKGPAQTQLLNLQKMLKENYPHATAHLFSSLNRDGLNRAWNKLDEWMNYERPIVEKTFKQKEAKVSTNKKKKTNGIRKF